MELIEEEAFKDRQDLEMQGRGEKALCTQDADRAKLQRQEEERHGWGLPTGKQVNVSDFILFIIQETGGRVRSERLAEVQLQSQ